MSTGAQTVAPSGRQMGEPDVTTPPGKRAAAPAQAQTASLSRDGTLAEVDLLLCERAALQPDDG